MSTKKKLLLGSAGAAAAGGEVLDVDQVFATHLYTGNGYSQFIKNGIDLGDGPTDGVAFHLRGDSFTDSSPVPKTVINSNNVPRSTSESKFGGGSYDFSGTNGVLRIAQSSATDLLGDFCFEYWFKGSHSQGHTIGDASTNTGAEFYITSNQVRMWINGGYINAAITYNSSQWNHIAWCRRGDNLYVIFNGVKTSEDTFTGSLSGDWRLGGYYYGGSIVGYDDGYYEDFRLTVGDYRYDGDISVPTALQPTVEAGNGEGGLVWIKNRAPTGWSHALYDTERGATYGLEGTNNTNAQAQETSGLTAFNSNGFSLGNRVTLNGSSETYASWTFRKAPKFFDVKTVTHTNGSDTVVSFSDLGTIGMVIAKKTTAAEDWFVSHRYNNSKYLVLNSAAAEANVTGNYGISGTNFTLQQGLGSGTYVLYAFAHNDGDGEFGPDADQDIIKCGSYTGNGSSTGPVVDLGFEPQWILIKDASASNNWVIQDVMRGIATDGNDPYLHPNSSSAETGNFDSIDVTATGFKIKTSSGTFNDNGNTHIYMAIRRGPLAPPESATDVFAVDNGNSSDSDPTFISNFPVDMAIRKLTTGSSGFIASRLTPQLLNTDNTNAEGTGSTLAFDNMDGYEDFAAASTQYSWMWKRAPSYFDVVAYTGTGSARTVSHNLGAVPEMMWVKNRSAGTPWMVYHSALGNQAYLQLNDTAAAVTGNTSRWNATTPTASVFSVGDSGSVNGTSNNIISYLFATVAGVSKVGSFTGNGSTQNIDCGFSSGARFVLIKRTDVAEGWKVHDSVRGIVSGNDPFLELNNTNAENSSFDVVDPYSGGFAVNNYAGWNASGGSYIFYAIA